jgi:hypothetical protein
MVSGLHLVLGAARFRFLGILSGRNAAGTFQARSPSPANRNDEAALHFAQKAKRSGPSHSISLALGFDPEVMLFRYAEL